MKLYIGYTCYDVPDEQVVYYTHEGEVKFVNDHVITPRYNSYQKIVPSDSLNFERRFTEDKILWVNKLNSPVAQKVKRKKVYTEQRTNSNRRKNSNFTLSQLVKDKKIIIVGPSPILIGEKKGSFIDSFDIVIRINGSYRNDNFIDYGKRTDILCINRHFQNLDIIVNEQAFKKENNIQHIIKKQEMRFYNFYEKSLDIDFSKFKNTQKLINTGIMLILELLAYEVQTLNIIGFSFYDNSIPFYSDFHIVESNRKIIGTDTITSHPQEYNKEIIKSIIKKDRRFFIDEKSLKYL